MKKKIRILYAQQIVSEVIAEIREALDTDESSHFTKININDNSTRTLTREEHLEEALKEISARLEKDVLGVLKDEVI
ncbi:hypothetical protein [Macrococcoides canis]|uniref:hypothetical protein n=1 Tax=Macrococcoides canis TaxID=1855823 RepID=UPI00165DCA0B|nr:hypothetical protein [Macrococcus canis]QNR08267.1 hypothetical protein GL258_08340 [Macrococcus canis]